MQRIVLFVLIFFLPISVFSCTTFIVETENSFLFARNLDWVSENGLLIENKRGVSKSSLVFPPDAPVSWVSKYGSITFNQFGKEFPFGGVNEEGLLIEIMKATAEYPTADKRPATNELQWIQYQLDMYKDVKEVIKNRKKIRVSAVSQELHYLITDQEGNKAVLEWMDGELNAIANEDLPYPVLENDVYTISLNKLKEGSASRFKKVVTKLEGIEQQKASNLASYSFEILDEVALQGSWSIVYDLKKRRIYYKTALYKELKYFDLSRFTFDCSKPSKMYIVSQKGGGDISDSFIPYETSVNQTIFKDGIATNRIELPEFVLDRYLRYPQDCRCL